MPRSANPNLFRIRRVKCGEEKPGCVRCTSTGRTCDGYDRAALQRYGPPDPARTAELAKVEFVRACQRSEALRSMRHIEADIEGTETEKRFIARFRAATAGGVAAHLCNVTAFWSRVAPSTIYQDETLRHAVVALSAAFQLSQYPDELVIDGFTRDNLDLFAIQHYNKSIERLQRHVGSSAPESVRLTLLCCLAFISLETLRGNHAVAVTHLVNGLRILQSLPDSTFACLADGSVFVWPPTRDSLNMPDIIQLFARFEISTCFFTHGIQPVVSERGYRTRHFDDGSAEGRFADVAHARRVVCGFQHDVMARLHQTAAATATGDDAAVVFWSDPAQQRQHACLLARSARIGALVADFFSPSRFGNTDPDTPELFSLYLDLLYFRCAQFLLSRSTATSSSTFPALNIAPFSYPDSFSFQQLYSHQNPMSIPAAYPDPDPDPSLLPAIFHLASHLTHSPVSLALKSHNNSLTDIHTRLLGPLYLVATHTPDEGTRAAAVRMLAESLCGQQEPELLRPFRGGRIGSVEVEIQRMAGLTGRVIATQRESGCFDTPRAVSGVGCLPLLWDALVGGRGGERWG